MSAIEFCRDRILEINEDDFDDWFRAKTQKRPELFVSRKREDFLLANRNTRKNTDYL